MEQPIKEENQTISIIKKALLIEDYFPCQKVMTHYLAKLNYQVDLAADSFTAIQNIEMKTYDLIIVDINIHGCLSGKKLIQVIRESKLNVGVPIIVSSAYVNKNNEEKYLLWGADAVLIKVCGMKGLEKAIFQCYVMPRYEREFQYKLKMLKKKWQENGPTEWVKKINDLRHLPLSILGEAIHLIKEYQRWNTFHYEEKRLS